MTTYTLDDTNSLKASPAAITTSTRCQNRLQADGYLRTFAIAYTMAKLTAAEMLCG